MVKHSNDALPGLLEHIFILALDLHIGGLPLLMQPWPVPDLYVALLGLGSVGQLHLEFVERPSHQLARCRDHIHYPETSMNTILKSLILFLFLFKNKSRHALIILIRLHLFCCRSSSKFFKKLINLYLLIIGTISCGKFGERGVQELLSLG